MKITLNDVKDIIFKNKSFVIDDATIASITKSYEFLKNFTKDKIIYGINTGFGPMAQWRVEDQFLKDLQYNIIRSHSTGMGNALSPQNVKAAMIARAGSFIQCKSGIHIEAVKILEFFINNNITPFIPEHGSVGASGDLVQLAHIALCMIGEGKVLYKGEWQNTTDIMQKYNISPLNIHIREGLSATNGTSVMTGISAINQFYAENLLNLAIIASVWMNEIASSYDDMMSESLNECRRHFGQQYIAKEMRKIAIDSKCLIKREHELYNGAHMKDKVFEHKVQAYYSLRCIPQILGPIYETLENSRKIIEEEFNSASDNPIVDPSTNNVYHGGNFHGDYISLEEDKVKIAMVRLIMTTERQLNYLFHDRINGILPPFLNMGTLGLNYGMQACQFTATSTTAECQTLAMPNYVHSIPNNNDNQDIVSMGTNTAEICQKVISNGYQVMAILFMALAQATDCLNLKDKLATKTREEYENIRKITKTIIDDTPFYEDLILIEKYLKNKI
ncbi:MAG: aromatic amino acid lyase [Paludibacteraceae bacterium]|nr:aromatic amino acid lyase [Paludibacteraceae bacterium]